MHNNTEAQLRRVENVTEMTVIIAYPWNTGVQLQNIHCRQVMPTQLQVKGSTYSLWQWNRPSPIWPTSRKFQFSGCFDFKAVFFTVVTWHRPN